MGWWKVKELKKKLFQGKPFIQKSLIGCQPFIQSTFTGCLLGVNHCAEDTEVKKHILSHPALPDAGKEGE